MQNQVAVIGAGPGGYVAAIRLAQLGQEVTLIERNFLGGVCLNWGCIPSKAMIHAATLYQQIQHADRMGIMIDNVRLEMPQLISWKNSVIEKLREGINHLLKNNGINLIQAEATFIDNYTLELTSEDNEKKLLKPQKILIAAGSRPLSLSNLKPDGKNILSSRHVLELTEIPESVALIGGGVIGIELGQMLAAFGAKVTIIEMSNDILPGIDPELTRTLKKNLRHLGVQILTEFQVVKAENNIQADGIQLTIQKINTDDVQIIEASKALIAIGRRPNTRQLGLSNTDIVMDEKGFIKVNTRCQTNLEHIYAIGDITGGPFLAHRATQQGLTAARIISGYVDDFENQQLPSVIYTTPEIATVGLTENNAKKLGYNVRLGKFPLAALGKAQAVGHTEGFVKLIVDDVSDIILGAHVIGQGAGELIGELTLAMELGATATDVALTIHAHPTFSESLMEAAEAVHQKAIHIYQPQKPSVPDPMLKVTI
ncbi:MAG: dihydrolipoyl dehydrogenase [Candidatus Melainabacteria bacterium]|nr:dihydrolipoyl dehydrogenase [Candidatus Melainabacteria bacterium]